MTTSHLPTPRRARNAGLCSYSNPEIWFDHLRAEEAKRICGNCPLRQQCAQRALDRGVTDGVWAGVRLPGLHAPAEERDVALRQLRMVAAAMRHQPESHRERTLALREAIHNSSPKFRSVRVPERESA